MTDREYIHGRPDFADSSFGITTLKRFPPYVYSLMGGMLVHKVREVTARWYEAKACRCEGRLEYSHLERRTTPRLTVVTVCGQTFYAGAEHAGRSRACEIPKPDAVLCGRCHGTGPVFGRGLAEQSTKRADARRRIGCVARVEP